MIKFITRTHTHIKVKRREKEREKDSATVTWRKKFFTLIASSYLQIKFIPPKALASRGVREGRKGEEKALKL